MTAMQATSSQPLSCDPAVQAWIDSFESEPLAALESLLLGRVWLGPYESAEVGQALPQFMPVSLHDKLDSALFRWLSKQVVSDGKPEDVSAKAYSRALVNAFVLVQALDLPLTRGWCVEHVARVWTALRSYAMFRAQDPRSAFLRAVALSQSNRGLMPFWMSLCTHVESDFSRLALFGLRRMPKDDAGNSEHGVPRALIRGLLSFGDSLGAVGDEHKKEWLSELDFLAAVYPQSADNWAKRFRDGMAARQPTKRVKHWLDERYPGANHPLPRDSLARSAPLAAPYWDAEVQPFLVDFDRERSRVAPALHAVIDKHRHYAKESGDDYFLVRTFGRLADFLLSRGHASPNAGDASWAIDLAQEAATWSPSNQIAWSFLARALDASGDWSRAQAVFWYARRRFPHNPHAHNQLGHALAMRGLVEEGEAVYRQAIRRFPDNIVCRNDFAQTLRVAGKLTQAVLAFRSALDLDSRNTVAAKGLAGTLIDLGNKDDAIEALLWAEELDNHDSKNEAILQDLRRRLDALKSGVPIAMKAPRPVPEIAAGDFEMLAAISGQDFTQMPNLGRATLWRNAERVADARTVLAKLGRSASSEIEHALLLVRTSEGWPGARDYLESCAARYPGDGEVLVHLQRARARCGDVVDWQQLRSKFEELAPVIRIEQNTDARLPEELKGDDLDEYAEQAKWVYVASANVSLRDVVQEDFLAARQVAL